MTICPPTHITFSPHSFPPHLVLPNSSFHYTQPFLPCTKFKPHPGLSTFPSMQTRFRRHLFVDQRYFPVNLFACKPRFRTQPVLIERVFRTQPFPCRTLSFSSYPGHAPVHRDDELVEARSSCSPSPASHHANTNRVSIMLVEREIEFHVHLLFNNRYTQHRVHTTVPTHPLAQNPTC